MRSSISVARWRSLQVRAGGCNPQPGRRLRCPHCLELCARRRRVVGALGLSQVAGFAGAAVSVDPRKGKTEMKKNVPFALFALLFVPLLSHAQGLGSITGRVMDPGGASVAGAQVTATQEG